MEPMNDRLRRLVQREGEVNQPPAHARERNWNAVAAALGLPTGGGPPPSDGGGGAMQTATGSAAKGAGVKWIIGAAVLGTGIAVVATTREPPPPEAPTALTEVEARAEPPAPRRPAVEPPDADAELLVPAPEPVPAPTGAPELQPKPRKRERTRPEAEPPPGLRQEVALIERARSALESGNHAKALALTREHQRTFADGELVPDRLNLAAAALCASGRAEEGRALIQELRSRWPRAPVTRRAGLACKEGEP